MAGIHPAHAQLVNGSFEEGDTGWVLSGNLNVDTNSIHYAASEGTHLIVFNGGQQPPGGILSQTFETLVGQVYRLDFDVGAVSRVNSNQQRMEVSVVGEEPLITQVFTVNAPGDGTRYVPAGLVFIADSTSTTLTFRDTSATTHNIDLVLDNVRLSIPPAGTLLNGGFEEGLAGWNASGNVTFSNDPTNAPTQGTGVALFNSEQEDIMDGVLSQSFPTDIGRRYQLSFDVGVEGVRGDQFMHVQVQGEELLADEIFHLLGPGSGAHYLPKHISFVADSLSTTVVFADAGTSTYFLNMLLDDVRIVEIDETLPTLEQLDNVTVAEGRSATFIIVATGPEPITYQWRRFGVDIPGATESSLTLTNVSFDDAGFYDVVVSNPSGSVVSSTAMLVVVPPAILLNGSFEYGSFGWNTKGWVATSTKPLYGFSEGSQMLHFNFGQAMPDGEIWQTFETVVGQTYQLDFDLGAFSLVNTREQRVQVIVEGESVLISEVRAVNSPGNGTEYVPQTFTFVADSTATTLTFRDVSEHTANIDLAMDNVRITIPPIGGPGASFTSIAPTANGFVVQFQGLPERLYDVERSEDFVTWTVLGEVETNSEGVGTCEDNASGEAAFYRIVSKPE